MTEPRRVCFSCRELLGARKYRFQMRVCMSCEVERARPRLKYGPRYYEPETLAAYRRMRADREAYGRR